MRKTKEGLEILLKYCIDGDDSISAEHDIIYCGPSTPEDISKEDMERLEELGFYFDDEEVDCFYKFT